MGHQIAVPGLANACSVSVSASFRTSSFGGSCRYAMRILPLGGSIVIEPNFLSRTLWIGDNLPVLRGINSGCVDLIYLDPPFNSKRIYNAPLGSKAAGASFDDTWTLDSSKAEWGELQEHADPALYHTVVGSGLSGGESMQAYLTFMALRIVEMHRVLGSTGSLYLHCDDTASHYLKQLLDCIFGRAQFQNEIVWKRTAGTKNNSGRYPRNTDRLFFYSKSSEWVWDTQAVPWSDEQIDVWYTLEDEHGRYMRLRLRNPSTNGVQVWRGLRHGTGSWNAPKTGTDAEWIEREFISGYGSIESVADRLESLDTAGLLHWPEAPNGIPTLKRYLQFAETTVPVGDVWDDIPGGRGISAKERTGWPTQKPLALLDRIVKASSNPGDLVLDPFAGCATTCIAAERSGRRWAGIDIDSQALEVTLDRLVREVDERNNGKRKSGGGGYDCQGSPTTRLLAAGLSPR